ncbi:MAG: glutamate 5-kinase, partial [Firmicutes bacterium]|nr:glutamate 5-kinase [Bacillota bacterium]
MPDFKDIKRIVIKVGTSTLTHPSGRMNLRRIEELSRVLSDLCNSGKEVILVSSGAIGMGAARLGILERPVELKEKQAAAAVGQAVLIQIYQRFFMGYNRNVAQILLTKDDTSDAVRRQNIINTFDTLLSLGVVPVVNANDTISTYEIEYTDNDQLSAVVASLTHADLLIILSDIDALFTADPKTDINAKPIHFVESITPEIKKMAGEHGSTYSVGGMRTKISAAEICTSEGISMAILNGNSPSNI